MEATQWGHVKAALQASNAGPSASNHLVQLFIGETLTTRSIRGLKEVKADFLENLYRRWSGLEELPSFTSAVEQVASTLNAKTDLAKSEGGQALALTAAGETKSTDVRASSIRTGETVGSDQMPRLQGVAARSRSDGQARDKSSPSPPKASNTPATVYRSNLSEMHGVDEQVEGDALPPLEPIVKSDSLPRPEPVVKAANVTPAPTMPDEEVFHEPDEDEEPVESVEFEPIKEVTVSSEATQQQIDAAVRLQAAWRNYEGRKKGVAEDTARRQILRGVLCEDIPKLPKVPGRGPLIYNLVGPYVSLKMALDIIVLETEKTRKKVSRPTWNILIGLDNQRLRLTHGFHHCCADDGQKQGAERRGPNHE